MKETRVSKYSKYRKSISKGDSKGFLAPSKSKEVSTEMGLFLKMQKQKRAENILIIATICVIILLLVIFGFKLF